MLHPLQTRQSPEQITNNDHFHLGSCGKAMTGAMMATLVAEDKIDWQTTLIEVFPEMKDSILCDYHNITLYQLLTHRGGIATKCDHCILYEDHNDEKRRYACGWFLIHSMRAFLEAFFLVLE